MRTELRIMRFNDRLRNRRVHLGEENFPLGSFLLYRLVEAGSGSTDCLGI